VEVNNSHGGSKSPRMDQQQVAAPVPVAQAAPQAAPPKTAPNPADLSTILSYSGRAVQKAKIKSDTDISEALKLLHREHLLTGDGWQKISVPKPYAEKWALSNTLELVELVISPDEREKLKDVACSQDDLNKIANSIQSKCMEKMLVYEQNIVEAQLVKKGKKSNFVPTYGAVGGRIKRYKQELRKLLNLQESIAVPLQDRPPRQDAGTPPDNTSIRSHFASRK